MENAAEEMMKKKVDGQKRQAEKKIQIQLK